MFNILLLLRGFFSANNWENTTDRLKFCLNCFLYCCNRGCLTAAAERDFECFRKVEYCFTCLPIGKIDELHKSRPPLASVCLFRFLSPAISFSHLLNGSLLLSQCNRFAHWFFSHVFGDPTSQLAFSYRRGSNRWFSLVHSQTLDSAPDSRAFPPLSAIPSDSHSLRSIARISIPLFSPRFWLLHCSRLIAVPFTSQCVCCSAFVYVS